MTGIASILTMHTLKIRKYQIYNCWNNNLCLSLLLKRFIFSAVKTDVPIILSIWSPIIALVCSLLWEYFK